MENARGELGRVFFIIKVLGLSYKNLQDIAKDGILTAQQREMGKTQIPKSQLFSNSGLSLNLSFLGSLHNQIRTQTQVRNDWNPTCQLIVRSRSNRDEKQKGMIFAFGDGHLIKEQAKLGFL